MAIRFQHDGMHFSADSAEEAAELVRLLRTSRAPRGIFEFDPDDLASAQKQAHIDRERVRTSDQDTDPWTPDLFQSYLRRLGDTQTTVLASLLINGRVSDEDLRAALKLPTNQALAGVLSGLSKQASAMGIDPREVFTVQNFRFDGKRHTDYASARSIYRIASAAGWPADDKMFIESA